MLASSRKPCGGGNVRGRIWNPPLRTGAGVAVARDGRNQPDDRRAGCPHPAAPRGGANARGRDESRPYDQRKTRGQPGNRNLVAPQTHVGADSISARFAAAGLVLASLVKGRWPSEARTEGLFCLEMPLTEGGAFWRGPRGRHLGAGQSPAVQAPRGRHVAGRQSPSLRALPAASPL